MHNVYQALSPPPLEGPVYEANFRYARACHVNADAIKQEDP